MLSEMVSWLSGKASAVSPGFNLWDPHSERREMTLESCPLTFMCALGHKAPHLNKY